MDEDKAQQIIVLAAAITIGSTVAGLIVKPAGVTQNQIEEEKLTHQKKNANTHRAIVGGFFAMAGCSVIASFAPEAGVGLAALVAGGAFFFYGLPVIEDYFNPSETKGVKGSAKTVARPTPNPLIPT